MTISLETLPSTFSAPLKLSKLSPLLAESVHDFVRSQTGPISKYQMHRLCSSWDPAPSSGYEIVVPPSAATELYNNSSSKSIYSLVPTQLCTFHAKREMA